MEYGSIEREIQIDAAPEVVFDVITSPEHILEWWNGAETNLVPTPGHVDELAWDRDSADPHIEQLTVVDADPPRLFSFRWVYGGVAEATDTAALLVTFELVPTGAGTLLKFSEAGFREKGWETAVLEQKFAEHTSGWDRFLPALADYAARVPAAT